MTETNPQPETQDMKQYYVLGAIVLIAVVVAGYLLRPKTSPATSPVAQVTEPAVPTPTPGPITKLVCDAQYYNPVIGFSKYYLSVEGGDLSTATKVDCAYSITQDNKVVATENESSPLTDKPQRGGSTFRCTTKGVELKPNVPTVVTVQLKDDLKASSSCSATFLLPTP